MSTETRVASIHVPLTRSWPIWSTRTPATLRVVSSGPWGRPWSSSRHHASRRLPCRAGWRLVTRACFRPRSQRYPGDPLQAGEIGCIGSSAVHGRRRPDPITVPFAGSRAPWPGIADYSASTGAVSRLHPGVGAGLRPERVQEKVWGPPA